MVRAPLLRAALASVRGADAGLVQLRLPLRASRPLKTRHGRRNAGQLQLVSRNKAKEHHRKDHHDLPLKIIQDVLFQANFYRDPTGLNHTDFLDNNQLAQWNGEGRSGTFNETFKENFLKTSTNVWVKGLLDTVVWPREGEWWGQVAPGDPWDAPALPMAQSSWYLQDTFGLRTASQQHKNHFESFMGEHIR